MIEFTSSGDFTRTQNFLKKMERQELFRALDGFGRQGVAALSSATPANTGLASESWGYEIEVKRTSAQIIWTNSDVENGFPVAVMIQYGHGTGSGGYVQGIDYINPALAPIFTQIAENVWRAVTSA